MSRNNMKTYVIVVLCTLTLAAVSHGQSATRPEDQHASSNAALQTELTAVEKGLWDAWKTNNLDVFQAVLRDDVVAVSQSGVSGKADVLNRLSNKACALTDYSLEDFRLTMIDKTTALLTFKGAYTCGGQNRRSGVFATIFTNPTGKATKHSEKLTSKDLISSKWVNAFCQETSN